ncbi:MAG: lipopolysaccharide biosynthesis protein, partial [Corynebacteriales bacterium]|nr:lipopolysaccharide biosynthesis protein [Mycobacteriales bacterium]
MAEQTTTHDGAARRQLVGKGSIYTLATAVQMLGVLVVLPILSRLLSRAEYGQVALATVITSTLGLVAALGLHAVITREYFTGGDGPLAARRLVAITIVVSIAIGGVGLATGPLWGAALGGFTTALALGALTSIAWAWITAGQAMLRATHSAGRFVTVAVVNVLGGQLLGLAAVVWISASATSYLTGVASGAFAAALLSLAWARPVWSGLADRAALRSWFAIALPTVPHSAALFLMSVGDRFVIQIQEGDSAVAAYSLAYQMGSLGIILIAAANNAWAPLIYGAKEERRWSILAKTTKDMVSLSALLDAGLAFA